MNCNQIRVAKVAQGKVEQQYCYLDTVFLNIRRLCLNRSMQNLRLTLRQAIHRREPRHDTLPAVVDLTLRQAAAARGNILELQRYARSTLRQPGRVMRSGRTSRSNSAPVR